MHSSCYNYTISLYLVKDKDILLISHYELTLRNVHIVLKGNTDPDVVV